MVVFVGSFIRGSQVRVYELRVLGVQLGAQGLLGVASMVDLLVAGGLLGVHGDTPVHPKANNG